MSVTAPTDITAEIRERHRRGQSSDQLIKVGERTGWWTAEDVDTILDEQHHDRLGELEEELVDRGVIEPAATPTSDVDLSAGSVSTLEVGLAVEAIASTALDGETQVIGVPYTATRLERPLDAATSVGPAGDDLATEDHASGTAVYVAVIQARELGVDHDYQRPLDEVRARRMANAWNPRLVGILDVSDRGADQTPRYAVINGQHRAAAAAMASLAGGDVWLACNVHEGLTVADEAQLMHDLDRTTKKLTGWDLWRARRAAGDQLVATVDQVAHKHGLRVDNAPGDGIMRSYGAAEKLVKLGGEQLLDNAFAVLLGAYDTQASAFQAPLLMGVGLLMHRIPTIDAERLTRALAGTRPEQLRATATALRAADGGSLHQLMSRAIAGQYTRTGSR